MAALPACCVAVGVAARRRRAAERPPATCLRVACCGRGGEAEALRGVAPRSLYELLGVRTTAGQAEIKQAYKSKLKICHPDVAGEEAVELTILLNDAYRVLADPGERQFYDNSVQRRDPAFDVSTELGPVWSRSRHATRAKPVWTGTPRSRSSWDRLAPEHRGQMWERQMFVYVDPFYCISCWNCTDAAPRTFCINAKNGKARAFNQWGDAEVEIAWAIASCPVDCISWVSREHLQRLEHVTAERMYELNNQMQCAMQIRRGSTRCKNDVQSLADRLKSKLKREADAPAASTDAGAQKLEKRIETVFQALRPELKLLGWPHFALRMT